VTIWPHSVLQRALRQKTELPLMYGDIDFSLVPERFTDDPGQSTMARDRSLFAPPPPDMIERVRAYAMLGDLTADAYAALMPRYGFRRLVEMLSTACEEGLGAVPEPPAELVALISDMETPPHWLDMELVREGARLNRLPTAVAAPWMVRGAFIATFLNKYSALPMALTGALGNATAARRVNETSAFFAVTTLPGALERHGAGFRAAAMVRLMHSMVRFNVLKGGQAWNSAVYGVPIPQVDQMPAGLISVFLLAYRMIARGRMQFTREERAQVEFSRYRCFLLGLPEDLLADTPQGIVDIMNARNGTLREAFDDATCGSLIRATLAAYLPPDRSLRSRAFSALEQRFSRIVFMRQFLGGDRSRSAQMGVPIAWMDEAVAAGVGLMIAAKMALLRLALAIPGLDRVADRRLVRDIEALLRTYGHAEFTTDATGYRPTVTAG